MFTVKINELPRDEIITSRPVPGRRGSLRGVQTAGLCHILRRQQPGDFARDRAGLSGNLRHAHQLAVLFARQRAGDVKAGGCPSRPRR